MNRKEFCEKYGISVFMLSEIIRKYGVNLEIEGEEVLAAIVRARTERDTVAPLPIIANAGDIAQIMCEDLLWAHLAIKKLGWKQCGAKKGKAAEYEMFPERWRQLCYVEVDE